VGLTELLREFGDRGRFVRPRHGTPSNSTSCPHRVGTGSVPVDRYLPKKEPASRRTRRDRRRNEKSPERQAHGARPRPGGSNSAPRTGELCVTPARAPVDDGILRPPEGGNQRSSARTKCTARKGVPVHLGPEDRSPNVNAAPERTGAAFGPCRWTEQVLGKCPRVKRRAGCSGPSWWSPHPS